MMRQQQSTIANIVSKCGIGLHKGININVRLKPAPANSGVLFKRSDLPGADFIEANPANVYSTTLATTLGSGENKISTIEHLMAALSAFGIDNIIVEVDGAEMPIFDGSASAWVTLLQKAGRKSLDEELRYYIVTKPFKVSSGDKFIEVRPSSSFTVETHIDFSGSIGKQAFYYAAAKENFCDEVGPSRTFCMLKDVEMMQSRGLALGGSLENAVVVGDDGILNPEGLRFKDEFVRHKTLDFIGDMYVAGVPIVANFTTFKSGHELNRRFLIEALAEPGLLVLTTAKAEEQKRLLKVENKQSLGRPFLLPLDGNGYLPAAG